MQVNRKQEEYLYFPVFPGISHLGGIGQGGISREIPPWYFPDNTDRIAIRRCVCLGSVCARSRGCVRDVFAIYDHI